MNTLAAKFSNREQSKTDSSFFWKEFRKNKMAVWSLWVGYGLVFIAVFADFLAKRIILPLDLILMRFIEIMNSIPTLLLLLALVAIFQHNTLWQVVLIIVLIAWTSIA